MKWKIEAEGRYENDDEGPYHRSKTIWLFLTWVASPVVVIGLVVLAICEIPGVLDFFKWLFSNARPEAQVAIMAIAGLSAICFAFLVLKREERISELKAQRRVLENLLKSKEDELAMVVETNIRLAEEGVKEDLWQRKAVHAPEFVEKSKRKARFISVFNLKGGVGKTTLTANLGACLALMPNPLKVLLVDLDFQSTLSGISIEENLLLEIGRTECNSSRLLEPGLDSAGLKKMAFQVSQVPNAAIIISNPSLDKVDFETQARFFLDESCDVRFYFRSLFHRPEISEAYDVVLFDCPPRLTTSFINAYSVSDYILIPTKLDEKSYQAIPRSLKFLDKLRPISQPKILGVVANEVQYRGGKLLNAYKDALLSMSGKVREEDPDLYIFKAMVGFRKEISHPKVAGIIPSCNEFVRSRDFLDLATELRGRIGK